VPPALVPLSDVLHYSADALAFTAPASHTNNPVRRSKQSRVPVLTALSTSKTHTHEKQTGGLFLWVGNTDRYQRSPRVVRSSFSPSSPTPVDLVRTTSPPLYANRQSLSTSENVERRHHKLRLYAPRRKKRKKLHLPSVASFTHWALMIARCCITKTTEPHPRPTHWRIFSSAQFRYLTHQSVLARAATDSPAAV
jgi:hypothetical protein